MPISSGLKHNHIRVGIVLPEDQINQLVLSWPSELLVTSKAGQQLVNHLTVSVEAGQLLIENGGQSTTQSTLVISCDDAVEGLSTGYGIHVNPVIAGRGFHWEKQIEVDLPGSLHLSVVNDSLKVINTLDVESYVACVATSEMGAEAPAALLAAQTIVARCWSMALAEAKHLSEGFDVCNDDCCQRYQGTSFLTPYSMEAALETRGQVLIFKNAVIDARYSKNCGGMVEDYDTVWSGGPVPYLIPLWDGPVQRPGLAVDDFQALWDYDEAYCSSKRFENVNLAGMLGKVDVSGSYYRWEKRLTKSQLLSNLKKYHGLEWTELTNIRIMERGPSARIKYLFMDGLDVQGSPCEQVVRSEYGIRQMFSESFLYSSAFIILNQHTLRQDEFVHLNGVGWGHGVGLCQMGALGMALENIGYADILKHYYPGTTLTQL